MWDIPPYFSDSAIQRSAILKLSIHLHLTHLHLETELTHADDLVEQNGNRRRCANAEETSLRGPHFGESAKFKCFSLS